MEIKTKFNLEESVLLLHLNKIISCSILEIHVIKYTHRDEIRYRLRGGEFSNLLYYESTLFKTKEELLASL